MEKKLRLSREISPDPFFCKEKNQYFNIWLVFFIFLSLSMSYRCTQFEINNDTHNSLEMATKKIKIRTKESVDVSKKNNFIPKEKEHSFDVSKKINFDKKSGSEVKKRSLLQNNIFTDKYSNQKNIN